MEQNKIKYNGGATGKELLIITIILLITYYLSDIFFTWLFN